MLTYYMLFWHFSSSPGNNFQRFLSQYQQDFSLIATLSVISATSKVILTTEEVITTTLKVTSTTTKAILATEEVNTATLKVISAITKAILATDELITVT